MPSVWALEETGDEVVGSDYRDLVDHTGDLPKGLMRSHW